MTQPTEITKQLLIQGAFLQRQATKLLAEFDINQQQFVVLKEIEERGPVSQKDLCSALLFEKANVSKIVAKLERLGLIHKQAHDVDSRLLQMTVSRKGKAVVKRGMQKLDRWNKTWLARLSKKETDRIYRALDLLSRIAKAQ